MSRWLLSVSLILTAQAFAGAQTVTLDVIEGAASERGGVPGILRFTRSQVTAQPLQVQVVFNGSSVDGNDYVDDNGGFFRSLGQVTIPANLASIEITLTPLADNLVEGEEILEVALAASDYIIGSPASGQVIFADDPPVITITTVNASSTEGQAPAVVSFSRLGGDIEASLRIETTRSGTATASTDYQDNNGGFFASFGQLTIPGNTASFDLEITALADNVVEGSESLDIELATGSYVAGSSSTAMLTLEDDPPVVNVTVISGTAIEGGASAVARFERSGGDQTRSLRVETSRSGTAQPSDYTDNNGGFFTSFGQVTIPGNQSAFDLEVSAAADNLVEGEETLIVELADGSYVIGVNGSGSISLQDDVAVVTLTALSSVAPEGGLPAIIRVTRSGGDTGADLRIETTRSGSAQPADYRDNNSGFFVSFGQVNLSAGQTSFDLEISAEQDAVEEPDENLIVTLAPGPYTIGAENSVEVLIIDPLIFRNGFEPQNSQKTCRIDRLKELPDFFDAGDHWINLATGLIWKRCMPGQSYVPETNKCGGELLLVQEPEDLLAIVQDGRWPGDAAWRLARASELKPALQQPGAACLVRDTP